MERQTRYRPICSVQQGVAKQRQRRGAHSHSTKQVCITQRHEGMQPSNMQNRSSGRWKAVCNKERQDRRSAGKMLSDLAVQDLGVHLSHAGSAQHMVDTQAHKHKMEIAHNLLCASRSSRQDAVHMNKLFHIRRVGWHLFD